MSKHQERLLTEEDAPKLDANLDTVVIVDNVPKVTEDKVEKLKLVIQKVMKTFGEVLDITLPLDSSSKESLGFCFVEFATPQQATDAVEQGTGYKLDKKHVFSVLYLKDFDKYINTPEEWTVPSDKEFDDTENLKSWLLNPDGDDQYVLRKGFNTTICLNRTNDCVVVYDREHVTDNIVVWSPKGTYLATFHRQGIALGGGKSWQRVARFEHANVRAIDFSPCETFIVTLSSNVGGAAAATPDETQNIIIWDIKTGEKKREFSSGEVAWPAFKWSHDDAYFARIKEEDTITIYESATMNILEKKVLKIPGVQAFSWSPTDNIISYWTPEKESRPARVAIMSIPSRTELTVKNLYNVKECAMYWQEAGDYLCVKVDRTTKSKKGLYTSLEIFSLRQKLIPCELLEIKEKFESFAWDPVYGKFAVIHGEAPSISVSFYSLETGKVNLLKQMDKVAANALYYSPRGQYVVIAGLGTMGGSFEFVDTGSAENSEVYTMNGGEHFNASDLTWDPTGRYVCTYVGYWRHQMDTGYFIWGFQGKLLQKYGIDKFYSFAWRPRPATLLSAEEVETIRKNYKSYQGKYEAREKLLMNKASAELIDKRRKMDEEWRAYQARKEEEISRRQAKLLALRPPVSKEDQVFTEEEDIVEFFVKEEVEVLDK